MYHVKVYSINIAWFADKVEARDALIGDEVLRGLFPGVVIGTVVRAWIDESEKLCCELRLSANLVERMSDMRFCAIKLCYVPPKPSPWKCVINDSKEAHHDFFQGQKVTWTFVSSLQLLNLL